MKKPLLIITLICIALLPCKAQLLQPRQVKIELKDGNTRKAQLHGYTDDAIVVKRIANNNTHGRMDTLSFMNIDRIKIYPSKHPYIFTFTLPIAGLIVGGIVGHTNEPAPTPGSIISLKGLTTIISALIGTCIGGGIGALVDISRKNVVYIIYGSESNFKEFVISYKL